MPNTNFPVSLLALSILALARFGDGAEPGLRPTDRSNPTALAQPNQLGSAPWAVRLGPVVQHDSRIAPRVIVTERAQQAPANQGQFVAHATGTAPRESTSRDAGNTGNTGNPGDAVLRRWVTEVEVPARLRDFDSRIALTEAKLESFRRRQSQLSMLNVYAAPETFGFFPTDIWPGVETYKPVTVGGAVRSFSPRSSFSHVLATLQNSTQQAELELEALRLERDRVASTADGGSFMPGDPAVSDVEAARKKTMATIDTELRLAEFRRQSCEARLTQMNEMTRLTYSSGFNTLQERLRLEYLQADLRSADLRYVQGLVRGFELERSGTPASSSRIAVAE
jgi:hypothetical protein